MTIQKISEKQLHELIQVRVETHLGWKYGLFKDKDGCYFSVLKYHGPWKLQPLGPNISEQIVKALEKRSFINELTIVHVNPQREVVFTQ